MGIHIGVCKYCGKKRLLGTIDDEDICFWCFRKIEVAKIGDKVKDKVKL